VKRAARLTLVVAICFVLCAGSRVSASPGSAVVEDVRTIAGDGNFGMKDGAALAAQFIFPAGLARGQDGILYISDEGAQRIRALKPDGNVITVAGSGPLGPLGFSVVGGYRDGPALQAQFNHPLGLAVGPDGALYIADSDNSCIRKLAHGIVTTVVGKPGDSTAVDGPRDAARLVSPRSISFDASGTLWVADYGAGLRRLAANGTLSTEKFTPQLPGILSVSVSPDKNDPVVIAASAGAMQVYHIATGASSYHDLGVTEGGDNFGQPAQIVALGHAQGVFTDEIANNVVFFRLPSLPYITQRFTRPIAGGAYAETIRNSGFADGARETSRFYVPRGVVVDGDSAIVADAGNHRIRRIRLPHTRFTEKGLDDDYAYDTRHFEIVLIGASYTFWDSLGDDSICANIEARINASHRIAKPVRCHTIRIDAVTLPKVIDYADNFLSFRHIDVMLVAASPAPVKEFGGAANFRLAMQGMVAKLSSKPQILLYWIPPATFVSNDEAEFGREKYLPFQKLPDELYGELTDVMGVNRRALEGLPIRQYDFFHDLVNYEKMPVHSPLFFGGDFHTNPRGNAFIASHLADYLLRSVITVPK
jgi:DNA-binding beta-propeller fold protein YncE